jgi:hypothetical protein
MNIINYIALSLFSITWHITTCAPVSAQDYSAHTNRTIQGAKVLLLARERFSEVRSGAEEDNSTARWNSALEDRNSSYEHRELAYICSHISYLDMLSVANESGEIVLPTAAAAAITSAKIQEHRQSAHEILCKIWVSHHYNLLRSLNDSIVLVYSIISLPVRMRRLLSFYKSSEVDAQATCSQQTCITNMKFIHQYHYDHTTIKGYAASSKLLLITGRLITIFVY